MWWNRGITLAGLSVNVPDRPVTFQGQSGTFNVQVPESGIFSCLTACGLHNLWL